MPYYLQTDKLLGVILLCNNFVNTALATLVTVITVNLFGEGKLALMYSTIASYFCHSHISVKYRLKSLLRPTQKKSVFLLVTFYTHCYACYTLSFGLLICIRRSMAEDTGY